VRRYLAEFLRDPRVVTLPRLLWWPILYGVILPTRPRRVAHAYRAIWTEQGSPLRVYSQQLADDLAAHLGGEVPVVLGMRYGSPSLGEALERLGESGVGRVLVLGLYPQYAAATTASILDGVGAVLRDRPDIPELRFVHDYHNHRAYIEALAGSVRRCWEQNAESQCLVISFHGLPCSQIAAGDPYAVQCEATAAALVAALELGPEEWRLGYQSRVGKQAWLTPYTDEILRDLPRDGVRRISVVCPGFAVDCLETLEEINIRYRQVFLDAGGEHMDYVPALNAHPDHAGLLAGIARQHLCIAT